MKRCPNCNDFALYDDNVLSCPICDAKLTTYNRNSYDSVLQGNDNTDVEPIRPNNELRRETGKTSNNREVPIFEEKSGFRYHYRGIITEINSHSRFHSRLKKWINAIFRCEPYQFGNTSHETIVRIEEFHNDRVSGKKRDLVYYGDVEGRFNYGDDVNVTAKKRGDRYIITNMYLNETETRVLHGPQIPSFVITLLSVLIVVAGVYITGGIEDFVSSGSLLELFEDVIAVILFIAVIAWTIRRRFRR